MMSGLIPRCVGVNIVTYAVSTGKGGIGRVGAKSRDEMKRSPDLSEEGGKSVIMCRFAVYRIAFRLVVCVRSYYRTIGTLVLRRRQEVDIKSVRFLHYLSERFDRNRPLGAILTLLAVASFRRF
jgi:hypothetical protein